MIGQHAKFKNAVVYRLKNFHEDFHTFIKEEYQTIVNPEQANQSTK